LRANKMMRLEADQSRANANGERMAP
jgi:hypothetical protein